MTRSALVNHGTPIGIFNIFIRVLKRSPRGFAEGLRRHTSGEPPHPPAVALTVPQAASTAVLFMTDRRTTVDASCPVSLRCCVRQALRPFVSRRSAKGNA
jgi:hypothetical protein